jgi:hypothetical protein
MVPAKRLVSLLPVLAILLAGCSGGAPMAPTNSDFFIAFPRIVIEFDQDGSPAVAGIPASMLGGLGVDVSTMKLDAGTIAMLQSGDIQHIEVLHKDNGLFIFVNAKLLPHVGWSAASFDSLGKTVESLGLLDAATAKIVKMVLPLVTNLGVDVVVKFPVKSGGTAVALRDLNTPVELPASSPATPGFIARLTIKFDEQGAASIANISTRDLAAVFGDMGFDFRTLELPPETVQGMQAANFQHLVLKVGSDGITIYVNSEPLPNIAWSDAQLQSTAELVNAFLADEGLKDVRTVVSTMLPQLRMVDAEIFITFPVAANQQAIPLPGSK